MLEAEIMVSTFTVYVVIIAVTLYSPVFMVTVSSTVAMLVLLLERYITVFWMAAAAHRIDFIIEQLLPLVFFHQVILCLAQKR